MSADLLALAERVEAATGPDRELDCYIAVAVRWHPPGVDPQLLADPRTKGLYLARAPHYTKSLGAARSLVPGNCGYVLWGPTGKKPSASVEVDGEWLAYVSGETPALALTAAALRAHATKEPSDDTA